MRRICLEWNLLQAKHSEAQRAIVVINPCVCVRSLSERERRGKVFMLVAFDNVFSHRPVEKTAYAVLVMF